MDCTSDLLIDEVFTIVGHLVTERNVHGQHMWVAGQTPPYRGRTISWPALWEPYVAVVQNVRSQCRAGLEHARVVGRCSDRSP
jgi:N-formylglutamate amidohydrolase